jgi:large subunit ribosomal protein L9
LPNKKALRANEANRKVFEANRARIEAENAARREEAWAKPARSKARKWC